MHKRTCVRVCVLACVRVCVCGVAPRRLSVPPLFSPSSSSLSPTLPLSLFSYHAFYQLVYGSPASAKAYKLDPTTKYRYLTPGGTKTEDLPTQDTAAWSKEYDEVDTALKSLLAANPTSIGKDGFYWRAIAGVLHLGQITFSPKADGSAGCEISDSEARAALAAALPGVLRGRVAPLHSGSSMRGVYPTFLWYPLMDV